MTNREKYHFDDFTLENYRRLIRLAKDKGFQFKSFLQKKDISQKEVLWRHDVEFEPDIALKMAQIEQEEGVKATYFFQLHSGLYNLFDRHYSDVFQKIKGQGHYVGLHFDCRYWNIEDEKQLDEFITLDRLYLERNLGVKIEVFSFHNTTPFTQSCLENKYGGLVNVYSSYFKQNYKYCGDSLGYWRFDRLEDVLLDEDVTHLQVLTHDANWSEEVLSPRKRYMKAVLDNAERKIKSQIDGMHRRGNLVPDDYED